MIFVIPVTFSIQGEFIADRGGFLKVRRTGTATKQSLHPA
jgi:hypothetical protein